MGMDIAVPQSYTVAAEGANQTLAALLRQWLPGQTWSQVRKLVAGRRVKLNGELWLDDARRLKAGDRGGNPPRSEPVPEVLDRLVVRYLDEQVVVVEKPSGISTVRHPAEYAWSDERRKLVP